MNINTLNQYCLAFFVVLLTACSSDEGGNNATIDGDWGGTIDLNFFDDAATGDIDSFTLSIANGQVSNVRINGVPAFKDGSIFANGNVYSGVMNDGTKLSIVFDAALARGALISDEGWFGVIQKGVGAPPLSGTPAYLRVDLTGNFVGTVATTDFTNYSLLPGGATCIDGNSCSVNNNGVVEAITLLGPGKTYSPRFGAWIGNPTSATDNIIILMTQDKAFIAGWACVSGSTDVNDCTFSAMSRI